MVELPVQFHTDDQDACALPITVDTNTICIFSKYRAARMTQDETTSLVREICKHQGLVENQCQALGQAAQKSARQALEERMQKEVGSGANQDGTVPFVLGKARQTVANRALMFLTLRDDTVILPELHNGSKGIILADAVSAFGFDHVLRQTRLQLSSQFLQARPGVDLICFSVERVDDLLVPRSSPASKLGCLNARHGPEFLLGDLPFGPLLVRVFLLDAAKNVLLRGSRRFVCTPTFPLRIAQGATSTLGSCAPRSHSKGDGVAFLPEENALHLLGLVVLVHRGARALQHALETWSPVLESVGEKIAFVQNWSPDSAVEGSEADPRVTMLRKYGFVVVGTGDQQGISRGIALAVDAVSKPNVLLLEEDFALADGKGRDFVRRHLHDAILLLHSREADVIRMRSTQQPGSPNCANVWQSHEHLLARPWTTAHNNLSTLCAASAMTSGPLAAVEQFGNDVIWTCGSRENALCAFSTHASWTNNPVVFRREFFLAHILPAALADTTRRTLEAAVSFSPGRWAGCCFVVAQSFPGMFTHDDRDKPQWEQTVCPDIPDEVRNGVKEESAM